MKLVATLLAAASIASTSSAHTLKRVRIDDRAAPALAETLDDQGFDVVEGSVDADSLELVVSDASWIELERRGLRPVLLEIGRPYSEILAEHQASGDAVPPGYSNGAQLLAAMTAAANAFPAICEVVDLTTMLGQPATFEGRHLYACKISDNVAQDEDEPAALVLCGSHCRELAVQHIGVDTINRLTTLYGSNPQVTAAVDGHEIWIVPNANPDGYEHVFNVDNLWRKNRRVFGNGIGVDLNRNYRFGWSSSCGGSTFVPDETYKGPSAESEPEVKTIAALHGAKRFARVIDYHSYGGETLWGYLCWSHPWSNFLRSQAVQLSIASGYGGAERPPSAHGEEYQPPLAFHGALAFLTEVGSSFQPPFSSAQAEATQVWGGTQWLLARPASLSGHVTDSIGGQPVTASIRYPGANFVNGETNGSFGAFGRYHAFLPTATTTVEFSAPGYSPQTFNVTATSTSAQVLEVALVPNTDASFYCTAKLNALGCTPTLDADGFASATAGSGFVLSCASLRNNKSGLLFYGKSGALGSPFQGGHLCVKLPITRTAVQTSGGSATGNDCTGALAFDFNAWIAVGSDAALIAGQQVNAQFWSRDPGFAPPNNTSLSSGAQFVIGS